MIDFRYHLVSLVAVFIALAVGIALGAGPLREGISSTLESEVDQLRDERADLRAQVQAADRAAEARDEVVDVLSAQALQGTMTGQRVGIVVLPGADRNVVDHLEGYLSGAGADVVLTAEVDPRAELPEVAGDRMERVREAAQLVADPEPLEGQDPTLGTVIAAVLTGSDEPAHPGGWLVAGETLEQAGLLTLTWRESTSTQVVDRRPPDALLVVGGGLTAEGLEEPGPAAALARRVELVSAISALDRPVVVAGAGAETAPVGDVDPLDPFVREIREDAGLRSTVSTVDNLESFTGQVSAAAALAWQVQGQTRHYGLGAMAETAVPQLPPVLPEPSLPTLPGTEEELPQGQGPLVPVEAADPGTDDPGAGGPTPPEGPTTPDPDDLATDVPSADPAATTSP